MRLLISVILLLPAEPAAAQRIELGVTGGIPLTETSDHAEYRGRFPGQTVFRMNRYTVGPALEVGLPFGLAFHGEALYKHARLDRFAGPGPYALTQEGIRADIWEFPLLLRRKWTTRRLGTFVSAGATLRRVGKGEVDLISTPIVPGYMSTRQQLTFSAQPLRYGIVAGVGVSKRLRFLSVDPELRYTHWTSMHWMTGTEQLEFLLGIHFGVGRK